MAFLSHFDSLAIVTNEGIVVFWLETTPAEL
jgi:hypothetical protein